MTKGNTNYDLWHSFHTIDDDTNTPWHRFVKEKLTLFSLNDLKVLEIGCGRGGFSNYLAVKFPVLNTIVASDYSAEGLRIASEKYGDYEGLIQWKQENIMAQSFSDNTFDLAISCETIEHISNPRKAIFELYRVLKPGGMLLLTCPNYFNLFGIWCLYRKLIGKPFTEGGQPYVNYIQMPMIYSFIRQAGFKVIEWRSSEFIVPARVPKHFWNDRLPNAISALGHRTYYMLKK